MMSAAERPHDKILREAGEREAREREARKKTAGERLTPTNGTTPPATIPTTPPAMVDRALDLARKGFRVFPIAAGKKEPPLIKDFPNTATRDEDQIRKWWAQWPNANTGNSTTKYGDNEALLVVDIDNKGDKHGDEEILRLDLEGRELPETYAVSTPTGGRHLYYVVPTAVRQGADVLARGVDIRSKGGYVVAPGSVVEGKPYTAMHERPLAPAPEWVIALCGAAKEKTAAPVIPIDGIDQGKAAARAKAYLLNDAPLALEGDGGDQTTYQVACRVKDLGVDAEAAEELLSEQWNPRCQPPWSDEDLHTKVKNAYRYGQQAPGIAAPEVEFSTPVESDDLTTPKKLHPFAELNKEFAVALVGGGLRIIREYTNADGRFQCDHLSVADFRQWKANDDMTIGKRTKSVADWWLASPERRAYDDIGFWPGEDKGPRRLNLFRGFAYAPAETAMHRAVDLWLEHTERNICHGDRALFMWLLSYCAHLIRKPGEKPHVALVLIGAKGTGKNAWLEHLGALLGVCFMVTANRRYLTSNFNSHLERNLLLGLDEAFWSGDKSVEGILKDLITGREHIIERKGHEPYAVANKTRVVILGNESWVVPASHDERRFAVFDVGTGRQQDRAFFREMAEGMRAGGYEALLRYLQDYDLDLAGVDINDAPKTVGLRAQQDRSLDPLPEWWLSCLTDGRLVGGTSEGWPEELDCYTFRAAFQRHAKERNITGRMPSDGSIGMALKTFAPGIRKRRLSGSTRPWGYEIPPLDQARQEWDAYCPPGRVWPNDD